MKPLHEIDDRIFTATPHGSCVCPLVAVDAPKSLCERHNVDKTGLERLYCRVIIGSFLACEAVRPNDGMPGTALKAFFASLGITPAESCQCDTLARQMDAWGIRGCSEHRAEIAAKLTEAAGKATHWQACKVAIAATRMGIAVNPLNPGDAMVSVALRLAELAMTTQAK